MCCRIASIIEERAAKLGIEPEFRCPPCARLGSANRHDPLFCVERKRRDVRHHHDQRTCLQIARPRGDSPIIGAGCYTDQDVGSAGATGSGEENIKVAGAHTIVENMRHGMSPQEAGIDALKRIVRNYNGDMNKLAFHGHDLLRIAQRRSLRRCESLERILGAEIRTSSQYTTELCGRNRSAAIEGVFAGMAAVPTDTGGVEEGFGVSEVMKIPTM